jgi:hypothetical protein
VLRASCTGSGVRVGRGKGGLRRDRAALGPQSPSDLLQLRLWHLQYIGRPDSVRGAPRINCNTKAVVVLRQQSYRPSLHTNRDHDTHTESRVVHSPRRAAGRSLPGSSSVAPSPARAPSAPRPSAAGQTKRDIQFKRGVETRGIIAHRGASRCSRPVTYSCRLDRLPPWWRRGWPPCRFPGRDTAPPPSAVCSLESTTSTVDKPRGNPARRRGGTHFFCSSVTSCCSSCSCMRLCPSACAPEDLNCASTATATSRSLFACFTCK